MRITRRTVFLAVLVALVLFTIVAQAQTPSAVYQQVPDRAGFALIEDPSSPGVVNVVLVNDRGQAVAVPLRLRGDAKGKWSFDRPRVSPELFAVTPEGKIAEAAPPPPTPKPQ